MAVMTTILMNFSPRGATAMLLRLSSDSRAMMASRLEMGPRLLKVNFGGAAAAGE
jgi:hypothetical protein